MTRILATAGAAVLLAGCGAQATATSPPGTAPDRSPLAATVRAVESVIDRAPLPPDARIATAQEAHGKGPQSTPLNGNLVQRHRTYVVPLGLEQAVSWFAAHQPPNLQSDGGSSNAWGPDGVTSEGLEFDGRRTQLYDDLEEQVGVFPFDGSHSVVRIDAMAAWLPQATRDERVPAGATAVVGVRVADARATPQHFRLTGRAVRQLARVLDQQRPTDNFTMLNCPNGDGGRDRLHFTGSTPDPVFHIAASGCAFIGVTDDGVRQPLLYGGPAVDKVLARILAHR